MSAKTDKLIESATKFIVKGQIDKAIKDYEQVVALDPNDLRSRQKLAELLVRVNRKQDAVTEFETIGKYYANNAYYLKAIAVYKQIQKIDPTNIPVSLTLADLNVKQGLEGNALAEFNTALAAYERDGDIDGVGRVLACMLAAYPENPTVRLKAAETSLKCGKLDDSYLEFTELALILHQKGNELAFQQVCEKLQQHFPDRTDFFLRLAESSVGKGDAAGALYWLRKVIDQDRQNLLGWELLIQSLGSVGKQDQLRQACNEMLLLFPDNQLPRLALISAAVVDGRVDEALQLIDEFQSRLITAGFGADLEKYCRQLLELRPDDLTVLERVRGLYSAVGNNGEMAAVEAKITTLSQAITPAPETVAAPAVVLAAPAAVTVPPAAGYDTDLGAWEDDGAELDLSSLEEGPTFEIESTALVAPTAAKTEDQDESAFAVNWDSEGLDLGEIDLVGLPLEGLEPAQETPPVAPAPTESRKKGQSVRLGEQLDDSDTETHYSLGIAYKEMGLLDEAINEFEIAAHSPTRRVDCMTLQGLCALDKGDLVAAEEAFLRVMKLPATPAELLCAHFELAGLLERKGNVTEALRLYKEVAKIDAEYCGVAEKVAALDQCPSEGYLSDQLLELMHDHDD